MFFNQYDIVESAGIRYLVVSVENETLLVYNIDTNTVLEVSKAECKRINTIADIRTKALYEASGGTITQIQTKPKLMDFLSKCAWIENAAMNHQRNAWFYNAIKSMDTRNTLKKGIVEDFYKAIKVMASNTSIPFNISGVFDNADITIKVTLVNKNGTVSVSNVKRIFGDDGVFGNIKKPSIATSSIVSHTSTKRSDSKYEKNRIAS